MKTNKERIYDFIRLRQASDALSGLSTIALSDALNISRSNVSGMLNELVEAGRLEKTNGRPVLYYLRAEECRAQTDCFSCMVGANGSLQHAIQLAKAAMTYPGKGLNTVLIGDQGTGKSFLAMLMHRHAVEIGRLAPGAPFIVINCRDYQDDEPGLADALSLDLPDSAYAMAKGGVLHLDNAHLASSKIRSQILMLCARAENPIEADPDSPILIIACDRSNLTACEAFEKKLSIAVRLPALLERPLSDRLSLMQGFFTLEAARAKRTVVVSAELLRCLLLYDCSDYNILQLKMDVKRGCANAYLREHANGAAKLNLYISDFEPFVRKGFLHYPEHREAIERLIPDSFSYEFSEETMAMSAIDRDKLKGVSLYDEIDQRVNELQARGLSEEEVNVMLGVEYETAFRRYWSEAVKQVVNTEQLTKLVGEQIVAMVQAFLTDASARLGRAFHRSVFYGLCLHISALSKREVAQQPMSAPQIASFVERHKPEYGLVVTFAKELEDALQIDLSVDEIVLMAMFLCTESEIEDAAHKPVILILLHGAGSASSLANCVNNVVGNSNMFALDIPFTQDSQEIYDRLKACVERIDRGGGILVLYDMPFLQQMLNTVSFETGIDICSIFSAITKLSIDWSRRAALSQNLHSLFTVAQDGINAYMKPFPTAIVTLCTTGIGGAEAIKTYVEQYGNIGDTKVIALSVADRSQLKMELAELQHSMMVNCIIGTNDPKLFGIPFLPVSEVLGCDRKALPHVLRFKKRELGRIDREEVFRYLDEQLEYVDMKKLKRLLPQTVEQLNQSVTPMSLDTEIGLMMHLACCINRIAGGEPTPQNLRRDEILKSHTDAYRTLRKAIKPMEQAFRIIIPDDEIANMILILYQL